MEGRAKADAIARRRDRERRDRDRSFSPPPRDRHRSTGDGDADRYGSRRDRDRSPRDRRARSRRDRSPSDSPPRRPAGPPSAPYMHQPPPPPVARERGVVARWFDKGYGFIMPEIGGEEIFVHNTDIEDGEMLEAGAAVQFVRGTDENKDGKARAQHVTGGCYPPKSHYVWGTVVRWGEDKGYGFVTEDDGDGEQIFCHDSAIIVGRPLLPGARVQFVKVWDPNKGKHRAEQVRGEPVEDPLLAMAMAPLKRNKGEGSGDPDTPRQGDWTCPVCEANVFATKLNCYRCQTPKEALLDPSIIQQQRDLGYGPAGTPVAGFGAGGGFENDPRQTKKGLETKIPPRPGDWTCPSCNLNVFASKANCFRCNAPKPGTINPKTVFDGGQAGFGPGVQGTHGGPQGYNGPAPPPNQMGASRTGDVPSGEGMPLPRPRSKQEELEMLRRQNEALRRQNERERLLQENAALRAQNERLKAAAACE